jgi:hypothetical protein
MGSTFRKTYKKRQRKEDPLSIVVKKLDQLEQEDATDAAGKVYAEKLRSLDVKQRIYVEKLISKVFFEAQLGNLSRYTTLLCRTKLLNLSKLSHTFNYIRAPEYANGSTSYKMWFPMRMYRMLNTVARLLLIT